MTWNDLFAVFSEFDYIYWARGKAIAIKTSNVPSNDAKDLSQSLDVNLDIIVSQMAIWQQVGGAWRYLVLVVFGGI